MAERCGAERRADPTLVGREQEHARLASLVAAALAGRGAGGMVRGEPGIGRTALLESVAAQSGARTIWARGTEAEAALPYAAAADLLLPLRPFFPMLPAAQREALDTCLAIAPGPHPGPLAVCTAARAVLAAAGARAPLLVVVDDLQWTDPASQRVLLFVARRLAGDRVALLLAERERPGTDQGSCAAELPLVRLGGLGRAAFATILARSERTLPPATPSVLCAATGGNPLALRDVLESGRWDPPELGPALLRCWSRARDALPATTRTALAVLAAAPTAGIRALEPVLTSLRLTLGDLEPARRVGLLDVVDGEPVPHPLLTAVVRTGTPLAVQRRVLLALAEHADGDMGGWPGAASALLGADDELADGLADAAGAAEEQGRFADAARTFGRSSDLTAHPGTRAVRLLAAASAALLAGQPGRARTWCDDALGLRPDIRVTADLRLVRGRAQAGLGHPDVAADELTRAGEAAVDTDAGRAAGLYAEAALCWGAAGAVPAMVAAAARGRALIPGPDVPGRVGTVAGAALVLAGREPEARAQMLHTPGRSTARTPHSAGPWELDSRIVHAHALVWLEEFDEAARVLGPVLDEARTAGAGPVLAHALAVHAELDWWRGTWSAAHASAAEAVHRAGGGAAVGPALVAMARIDAVRGEVDRCRERLDRATLAGAAHAGAALPVQVAAVLGLAALSAGEPETAVAHLDQAWRTAARTGLRATNAAPAVADLVEAWIRSGHPERTGGLVERLEERAVASGLAHPTAAAARCRGMLAAGPAEAQRCFAVARRTYAGRELPFEHARTLLAEGETLRRLRRPLLARDPLREAVARFTALGARPWAARAGIELAATGVRTAQVASPEPGALSPQEREIARAVADGLNNSEAAAALFISRKTVEAHLTRIYRKLGVRSRTDLARRLAVTAA